MTRPGIRLCRWAEVPARLWPHDGLPFGLISRLINEDPDTGGATHVIDVPTGWMMGDDHWNTADLELVVLEGDLVLDGVHHARGAHRFIPSGTRIGPIFSGIGCRLILWHDSTYQVHKEPAPGSVLPSTYTVNLFDETAWLPILEAFREDSDVSSHADLEVPTRMLRLRRYEDSGMDTMVFILPPGFQKTSLEYHHATEEIFFLDGWCATDPNHVYYPGDYLCWAPGTIHGVVSGWGAICLSKHHGKLTSPNIPVGATGIDIV